MNLQPLFSELRAVAPVRESEPLARHTTLGVGGPADLYIKVETVGALVRVLDAARRYNTPWFVLGAGSNLVVGDGGIRGLVVEYDAKAVSAPEPQPDGAARFRIEAGASFAQVARRLSKDGYSGLEWAVGIPGTLGGAVVTNAGAYDGCLSDVLVSVCVVDPETGVRDLPASDFQLAYRESVFTRGLIKDVAVASVVVELRPGDPAAIMALVAAHDADRTAAQPAGRNTGSVFKNPPGRSAWQLIDAAGLRGHRIGGAEITGKHTNFFANVANARAADFTALMDLARACVRDRFGVELEAEVWLVGEFKPPPSAPPPHGGRGEPSAGAESTASPLSRASGPGPAAAGGPTAERRGAGGGGRP